MIRGVERRNDQVRVINHPDLNPEGWMDWREAEKLAIDLLTHVRFARDRELAQAGLEPGTVERV